MGFLEVCRPVIGIDGCHLKRPYGGVILSAISLEANLGYFPVAYAIVETENRATWCWFLDFLKESCRKRSRTESMVYYFRQTEGKAFFICRVV